MFVEGQDYILHTFVKYSVGQPAKEYIVSVGKNDYNKNLQAAKDYIVTLEMAKHRTEDELEEGKHWFVGQSVPGG